MKTNEVPLAGVSVANTDDGLEWPLKKFNGTSRRSEQGAIYAPYVIERFTRVEGDRLKPTRCRPGTPTSCC
jgi:hypothetical protein